MPLKGLAAPVRWTLTGAVAFAIAAPDSAAWRVTLDGRTVARGTAMPGTVRAPARVAERLGSNATGWVRGSVELDADELRGDDARFFAVRVAPPPTVTVRSEAGTFLSTALQTLVEEQRLARGTEGSVGTVTVAGADAAGVRTPVLLTAPSDPVRVGEANRTLARLGIPWRFGAIARDFVLTRSKKRADSASGESALDNVPVRLRYPLVRSPGTAASAASDTLAVAGGAPWAVSGVDYLIIASPFELDATDFPIRAGFVPWLLDALSRRLGDDGRVIDAHPGQHLTSFDGISALERPDGSLVPMASDRLTVPNEAGVYFLRRLSVRAGALVVNPEPEESDVGQGPGDGAAMMSHLTGRVVKLERDGAAWRRTVLAQAVGRSLVPPLVAIALVALLLEAWFSRERSATGADGARVRRARGSATTTARAA